MRFIILILTTFIIVTGCSQESGPKILTVDDCKQPPLRNMTSEMKAKSISESVNGIDSATALYINDELDVAIKASNINLLKIETMEKEVFQKLKAAFPDTNIFVTDDSKFYKEMEKIGKKTWPTEKDKACKQRKKIKQMEEKLNS
ncbi:MAG: YhcN/YlaJ family sporulation lipoprotein [Bacilli bacterium]